jgi:hypothetical protein
MRRTVLLSFAIASLLPSGPVVGAADAAGLTPALTSDHNTPLLQRITNVCGANGCVRVQTQRVKHQKPGSAAANHI